MGKSTIIPIIVDALNLDPKSVAYVCPTGKACKVLRNKGTPNASTLHSFLYHYYRQSDGTWKHKRRKEPPFPCSLVVLDEASMVSLEMWKELLDFGIPVIATADPFQLPPVGGTPNSTWDYPHIFLDEIHRQAAESDIIRLCYSIRTGKDIPYKKTKEVNVISPKEMANDMLFWADQVLCGRNATRNHYNQLMRKKLYGVEDTTPVIGEKISCKRNNWDLLDITNSEPLVNGEMGYITKITTNKNRLLGTKCTIDFKGDNEFKDVLADYKLLTEGVETVDKSNFRLFPPAFRPNLFDFGYVLSVWRAQGSQYEKVLFIAEEKMKYMTKTDYARYLYTGASRPEKSLILVI